MGSASVFDAELKKINSCKRYKSDVSGGDDDAGNKGW